MNFYDRLCYKTTSHGGNNTWFGNDRWFVQETEKPLSYVFCCSPVSREHGQWSPNNQKILKRTLFALTAEIDLTCEYTYGVDYVSVDEFKICVPYGIYGALISSKSPVCISDASSLYLKHGDGEAPSWELTESTAIITDGIYTICIMTDGKVCGTDKEIKIVPSSETCNTAVTYNIDRNIAAKDCEELFYNKESKCDESREFWEDYLSSCPIVPIEEAFRYHNEYTGRGYYFEPEDFLTRQYWHWWCLLINVSDIEFNEFPIYMAPDKIGWFGTWSNDGPECMAALSLTNQAKTARRLIVSYIDAAITDEGVHSWYLHGDGIGCNGRNGDVGRLSHGAPCIVHTVDFYIRSTDDESILKAECVSGLTVYEKLKKYITTLHEKRDINGDGLIEWVNLWETGWDDKLGCFFKSASMNEWLKAVAEFSDEELKEFYKKNCFPVAAIVEQVYTIWAMDAMTHMAELYDDKKTADYCIEMSDKIKKAVSELCWNESDGFYHDLNVREGKQIPAQSADCFYYLYFEKDQSKREAIYSHLFDQTKFNLCYLPMQSADCEGFSPKGYWSGGHWPREMSYLSMGLYNSGFSEKSREILIRAIMSGGGNRLHEVINPMTGKQTSGITKMAYNVMDIVAWLMVNGKLQWSD